MRTLLHTKSARAIFRVSGSRYGRTHVVIAVSALKLVVGTYTRVYQTVPMT